MTNAEREAWERAERNATAITKSKRESPRAKALAGDVLFLLSRVKAG